MKRASAHCLVAFLWLLKTNAEASSLQEDFSSDPISHGWSVFGDTNLFQWDSVAGTLAVAWDSTRPNSYFYHPLGAVVTKRDDVQVSFDLRLGDIAVGLDPGHPFTFEVAVGLLNLAEASGTNFQRGSAAQSPDLLEFDYFPDSGFGATVSPVVVSSTGQFVPSFTFPLSIGVGDDYQVSLRYSAADQTLRTTLDRNGVTVGPIKSVLLGSTFTDFKVDTVAICSYSDHGADGSLLAHGWIDNLTVTWPDPPIWTVQGEFEDGRRQVSFLSEKNWTYTLERSEDGWAWSSASAATPGNGLELMLQDDQEPGMSYAFYRVRADRP